MPAASLYPVSAFPMSPDDWRRHLGPAHAGLAAARTRWDPLGVPHPGLRGVLSGDAGSRA